MRDQIKLHRDETFQPRVVLKFRFQSDQINSIVFHPNAIALLLFFSFGLKSTKNKKHVQKSMYQILKELKTSGSSLKYVKLLSFSKCDASQIATLHLKEKKNLVFCMRILFIRHVYYLSMTILNQIIYSVHLIYNIL